MNIGIGSLIASLLTGATVSITLWEAFTNRSKLKLSLYEKRFEIFKSALELHLALLRRKDKNVGDMLDEFTKKYREAKFLFAPKDKILELYLKRFISRSNNVLLH